MNRPVRATVVLVVAFSFANMSPAGHQVALAQNQCLPLASSDWDRLLSFRPPTELQQASRSRGWTFQPLESRTNDQLNLDYYAVVIDRPPRINGVALSPELFLQQIRRRFAGFIDRSLAQFTAARSEFEPLWQAGTTGAVMRFAIAPTTIPNLRVALPAQVMLTEGISSRWIFSTGHLTNTASHPVNGNREFGVFTTTAQGTFTFYTRGADTLNNEILSRLPGGAESVFGGGERIWEEFQDRVIEFVTSNGGHVSDAPSSSARYCWSTVAAQHFRPTLQWLGQAPQASDRVVTVRRRDLSRILWSTNATAVTNSRNYGLTLVADYLTTVFDANERASPQQIIPALKQVLSQYDTQKDLLRDDKAAHLRTIASLLSSTPGIDGAILNKDPALMGILTQPIDEKHTYEQLFSLGQSNSRAKQVIEEVLRPRFGAAILDSPQDVVRNSPVLQANTWINSFVAAAERNSLSDAFVEQLFSQVNASSRSVLRDNMDRLRQIDAAQRNFTDFLTSQFSANTPRQVPPDATARRAQDASALAGADAAVNALSSVAVIMGNPQLSRTIATVGSATIAISNAVSAFTESSSNPGASIAGLGASLLSGNVVGAVFKIAGLFGLGGPSTDEMILEEVRAIRSDLREMNEQMNSRFDNIDRTLQELNAKIEASFDRVYREFENLGRAVAEINQQVRDINERTIRIERELTQIQARMVGVETDLGEMQSALDRFDRRMQLMLRDGFGQQLVQYIDRCVGFRQTYGRDMDTGWYDDCENVLYSWAVAHAANASSTGSTIDSSYAALAEAIEGATGQRLMAGEPQAGRRAVPNLVVWKSAADAYVQLAVEWPQHRRRVNTPARVQQIVESGTIAESAINALIVSSTSQSTTAENDLYGRLVAHYSSRLEALKTALKALEAQHQQRLGYDMWGPVDQPTRADPTKHQELNYCPAEGAVFDFDIWRRADPDRPFNMITRLAAPPGIQDAPELRSARILERLGLTELTYCFEVWPGGGIGRFEVFFRVWSGINGVMARLWTSPEGYGVRNLATTLTTNWPLWKDRAFSESRELDADRSTSPTHERVASQVQNRLSTAARAFYDEVAGSLRSGGGDIGRASGELDDAKKLIETTVSWAEPETLDRNDALASMLRGTGGLLDSRALLEAVYDHADRTPLPQAVMREDSVPLTGRLLNEWFARRVNTAEQPGNWQLRESLAQLRALQRLAVAERQRH